MAKKRPIRTPEQEYARMALHVRKQLHRGLDQVLDDHMADFLLLLSQGYVLVANVHPFKEADKEPLPDGVVGEIPALLDGDGNPLVRN